MKNERKLLLAGMRIEKHIFVVELWPKGTKFWGQFFFYYLKV